MVSFISLFRKEIMRFYKVAFQTVLAPVVTSLLYVAVFSPLVTRHLNGTISYTAFLMPGLAMMTMLQNAFSNTSSSLVQSKLTGNLIFILLSPISYGQFFAAYVLAAVVRGFAVGIVLILLGMVLTELPIAHIGWIVLFAFLSNYCLASVGLIVGIWADKFDQLAAFQNFIIVPLTFLSGVFYSIYQLPALWQTVCHYNPIFHMIDGFRYGFFGHGDINPWLSLGVVGLTSVLLTMLTLRLLQSGYKLRP